MIKPRIIVTGATGKTGSVVVSELLKAGKRVVWRVLEADLSFAKDKSEWKGTEIVFEIAQKGDKTEVRFTHVGLVPAYECYNSCSNAWGLLVKGNLRRLVETGEVQPSPLVNGRGNPPHI